MHRQRLHTPPLLPLTRPLVDACTASGYTPLHYAAWFNQSEVIKVRVINVLLPTACLIAWR